MSSRAGAFFACGAVLSALLIGAADSQATTSPKPPVTEDAGSVGSVDSAVLDRQAAIHSVTDPVWDRAEAEDLPLAGVAQDLDSTTFKVYWKGDAPEWVRDAVESSKAGIQGEVVETSFSDDDLSAASRNLLANPPDGLEIAAVRVLENDIGESLTVELDGDSGPAKSALSEGPTGQAHKSLSSLAGVPVSIQRHDGKYFNASRTDDSPPWYGGGSRNRGGCSIAFGAWNSNHNIRLLSAWHCTKGWGDVVDGVGDPIGHITVFDQDYDAEVIDPDSTTGGYGWVFTGPWYSSTAIKVSSATWSNFNDYVCTSGARSGQHCNLRVLSIDEPGYAGFPGPFIRANAATKQKCALVSGDSGGAVYDPTTMGTAHARGIISGGVSPDTYVLDDCNPVRQGPVEIGEGGYAVIYKQLPNVLSRFNLSIAKAQ